MLIDIEYAPYFFVLLVVVLELSGLAVGFPLSLNSPFDNGLWCSAGFDFEIDETTLDMPDIIEVALLRSRPLTDYQEAPLRLTAWSAASKVVTISRHCHLRSRSDSRDE